MNEENKVINIQEKPDSITVKETSKGELYFEVKCYGNTALDEKELIQRAHRIYHQLVSEMRPKSEAKV